MENIIEAKNLVKDYKGKKGKKINALKRCSFNIEKGKSVGFVGLNGAGKSTTIKLLTGIMKATSGSIRVLEVDPFVNRKSLMNNVGVLFGQRSNLIYDLPVKDSFKLLKAIYNISASEYENQLEFLEKYIEFNILMDVPVRQLSLGQRMRCEVASILLHNPQLVFFDEAFLGIDFKSKSMIRKMIDAMRNKYNTTFFITSHDIRDIERMCNEVIIINDGNIISQDNINNIIKQSKWIHLKVEFKDEIEPKLLSSDDVILENYDPDENSASFRLSKSDYESFVNKLNKNYSIISYKVLDCNLEEIIESIYEEMKRKHE